MYLTTSRKPVVFPDAVVAVMTRRTSTVFVSLLIETQARIHRLELLSVVE